MATEPFDLFKNFTPVSLFACLAVTYLIWRDLYNVYLHPLAEYPGPWLARLTRLYYCWYCLRGDIIYALDDWHKQYGDIIRVAPDELSYCCPEAWNEINGHRQGMPELARDANFFESQNPGPNILNSNRERHALLRKHMSHGFSERALREQEPVISSYVRLLVRRLGEQIDKGQPTVGLLSWINASYPFHPSFCTFDLMGQLAFGKSFNCLESSAYHSWTTLVFDSIKLGAFFRCSNYWPFLTPLLRWMIPKHLLRRRMEVEAIGTELAEYRKTLNDSRRDLVSGLLKEDNSVTDVEFDGTIRFLINAGGETVGTLVSGAIFYLLKHPDAMDRLVSEIRSAFASTNDIDLTSVNRLPYLLACLQESLRIYPPTPDGFPRNTGTSSAIICGRPVPPHTILRVTHWPTHRSPKNFVRPDEFLPERWLPNQKGFENDRKEALQPFGFGPRNCIGRNLAYFEMRLILTHLLWTFDFELDPRSRDWNKQKAYLLWEKQELFVKIQRRQMV